MKMKMPNYPAHPSSYRDPSGFIFQVNGIFYRQVNFSYAEDYALLMQSGLYRLLTKEKLLISHEEAGIDLGNGDGINDNPYLILFPQQLTVISYPYEWSFDQLKDAALLTLTIMRLAIEHGMILKDATPFNIQFREGIPLFIDTLSFEKYDPSKPWIAYRQFCESFLFPLYLEHYAGPGLQKILCVYPDGIPASVITRLLPWKSRFRLGVWLHVHLPNKVRNYTAGRKEPTPSRLSFNRQKMLQLIQSLEHSISGIQKRRPSSSPWKNYYSDTILSKAYLVEKEKIFRQLIEPVYFGSAVDAGANDGYFSFILAERKAFIISVDSDAGCIEALYQTVKEKKIKNILPLCVNIACPSPAIGFRNTERASFNNRISVDLVVALALIHHLVFSSSIPLYLIPGYFAGLTKKYLIIEYVPLSDPKTIELIKNKKSFHSNYDQPDFENEFRRYFSIEKKIAIAGTERVLYLMEKKNK